MLFGALRLSAAPLARLPIPQLLCPQMLIDVWIAIQQLELHIVCAPGVLSHSTNPVCSAWHFASVELLHFSVLYVAYDVAVQVRLKSFSTVVPS